MSGELILGGTSEDIDSNNEVMMILNVHLPVNFAGLWQSGWQVLAGSIMPGDYSIINMTLDGYVRMHRDQSALDQTPIHGSSCAASLLCTPSSPTWSPFCSLVFVLAGFLNGLHTVFDIGKKMVACEFSFSALKKSQFLLFA